MKKIRKIIYLCIAAATMLIFGQVAVYAETDDEILNDIIGGVTDFQSSYSNEAKQFFDDNDINISDPKSLTSLNIKDVIGNIFGNIKDMAVAPVRLLLSLLTVILLASLIQNIGDSAKKDSIVKMFNIISILISTLILYNPIADCINGAVEATSNGATFMLSFVPVFSGVIAGSGGVTSAGAYNLIVLFAAEIAVQFSAGILMPMMSLCMALAIVDAINPAISLSSLIEGIKKACSWCLGLSMTFFAGLLSLQSLISNAADTLSVKTGKFLVSNMIPVIGSAISDAYTTLKGSLGLIRNAFGGIGIIVILITVMPTVITIGLNRIVFGIAEISSDIFNISELNQLFKNVSSVTSIAFSIVISFAVMFIVSTAIIMAFIQV